MDWFLLILRVTVTALWKSLAKLMWLLNTNAFKTWCPK